MHKILIVDDTELNVTLIAMLLSQSSYIPIAAYSGEEALNLAEQHNPDLILLDIMMPGMDGFETCKRLKANEKTKHIPIVFVTAYDSPKTEAKSFSIGGYAFIKKPINCAFILEVIEDCLLHHRVKKSIHDLATKMADQ